MSLVVSLGSVTMPLALNCENGVPVSASFDFEIIEVVALVRREKRRRYNKQAVQSCLQSVYSHVYSLYLAYRWGIS